MREMYWPSQLIFQRHTRLFAFKMNQKSSKNCKFLSEKMFANIDVIDNKTKLASLLDWKKSSNCTLFNFNNAACKKKVFAPFFSHSFLLLMLYCLWQFSTEILFPLIFKHRNNFEKLSLTFFKQHDIWKTQLASEASSVI